MNRSSAAATLAAALASLPGCHGTAAARLAGPLQPEAIVPNLDSAVIKLPAVAGAKDYRAFAMTGGVKVTAAGDREHVEGATIWCAGQRQRNSVAASAGEALREVEISGLTGPAQVVVEAIDRPCPFSGVMGSAHASMPATFNEIQPDAVGTVDIFTEAELRERYGSLIVNGHGGAAHPGWQADPDDPVVLASSTVSVTPVGNAVPRTATFFDDFSAPDQPVYVGRVDDGGRMFEQGRQFQNQKWNFYAYGNDPAGIQIFTDRGQLHVVLADWSQDIFSSVVSVPRKVAHLPSAAGNYLHFTYEVPSDSTQRRYWWLAVCGAAAAGQTLNADGSLAGHLVQTAFFYQPDGRNPSLEGWNCFQLFPRDGSPFGLQPTDQPPESDLRVMVNLPLPPPDARNSVVNLSPDQYGNVNIAAPGWFRQMKGTALSDPMLDDQLFIGRRTRFDLYLSRTRAILYVNGGQRLCNDFPRVPLSMAEAMVSFGQVLYHSAAERNEFFRSYWDRTGQLYYIHNTPFVDQRSWDNLGFQEDEKAPATFDAASCYVAP